MSNSATRWGIYLRISRTDDRRGVERQLDECQYRLSEMGHDEDAIELYDENNTSATKGIEHRPEYRRMMADAKAGRIGGVMVFVQDRGWRDFDEVRAFAKTGIRFATSTAGEQDLSDPMTRHAFFQAGLSAEHEVEMIAWRVTKAARQRAKRGAAHGRAPFGWRREVELRSGRVVRSWDVIDEAEAGFVRHAAEQLIKGISLRTITAEANAGSVKPRPYVYAKGPRAGTEAAGVWSSNQIKALLRRESNVGLRTYTPKSGKGPSFTVEAEWPAIIDRPTHDRLVALFADRTRITTDKGSARRWLLSGIAKCSRCADGGRIVVNVDSRPNRGSAAYVCVGMPGGSPVVKRDGKATPGCFDRHWVADVDAYIEDLVDGYLRDNADTLGDATPEALVEINALYAAIDHERAEYALADEMYKRGELGLLVFNSAEIKTQAAIKAAEDAIEALQPTLIDRDLAADWDAAKASGDVVVKRAVIRQIFDSIELVPSVFNARSRTADTIGDEIRIRFRG